MNTKIEKNERKYDKYHGVSKHSWKKMTKKNLKQTKKRARKISACSRKVTNGMKKR